ncbi:MAG: SH3 domain-containing protein [Caldilineaceae bacterium]
MHEQPRRTLCQLIKQYGLALHADPRRTEALLRDLGNAYPREIFVLVHAQKQQVAADLLNAPRWLPQQVLTTQLVKRLQEELALSEEAAQWAVETWAIALNIQPAPPDRAWLWLKQHMPTQRTLQPGLAFIHTLPAWGVRLFPLFGVKLTHAYAAVCGLVKRCRAGNFFWLRSWRLPIQLAIILGICAVFIVGSINRNVSSSVPTPLVVDQVSGIYPLPRTAWVGGDQLTVRAAPTINAAARGLLPAGQMLTVIEFSQDGVWSQIAAPAEGWVANAFVLFQSPDAPEIYTIIKVEHAQIKTEQLNVRNGPGLAFPIVGSLGLGQTIEIVATTQDKQWKQIITPIRGWVSTNFVQVSE